MTTPLEESGGITASHKTLEQVAKDNNGRGKPYMEFVADEIYDTKYLDWQGVHKLAFFKNIGCRIGTTLFSGRQFTNIDALATDEGGFLHNPREFLVCGIAVDIFSISIDDPNNPLIMLGQKEIMRQALFGGATMEFVIGAKSYWGGPLSRVFAGTFPCYYKEYAERHRTDRSDTVKSLQGICSRPIHYIDLTLPAEGGPMPLYIPAQQSFKVEYKWEGGSPHYYYQQLGHVMLKTFLCGYMLREVC